VSPDHAAIVIPASERETQELVTGHDNISPPSAPQAHVTRTPTPQLSTASASPHDSAKRRHVACADSGSHVPPASRTATRSTGITGTHATSRHSVNQRIGYSFFCPT
jgi:hypothetical protein